jgi:dsDNA-specific endonuclease/ATPase MutS2
MAPHSSVCDSDWPDAADDEPVRIPITDVFDLHSVPPRDVKEVVREYLIEAHRLGFTALRIIHGRGVGVQREIVHAVLAGMPFVVSFGDAPAEAGGWGATTVTLSAEEPATPPE